ncbi:type II secretion system protein [Desulfosporosinus hippei]|uniref:General secretion pathway protein G n=1 Tax=Desulfosporosinus hippei DSM 8344 TaxID=1121419 RepID=A0A1G8GD47_9FIRM|nr:prepilin-type N-terminal cleavage/methylation domain-containing protein [Desulfosporosinus hippei]SDH92294.1 general secretion pathway protein G [Desulfosporosinus hippei DSM 8344]
MSRNRGFTLIEMMIVLVIIGIIVSAGYPSLPEAVNRSRETERSRHEYVVNKALKQYYALTGKYPEYTLPVNLSSLKDDLYSQTGVSLNVEKYPNTSPQTFRDPDGDGKCEISSLHVK